MAPLLYLVLDAMMDPSMASLGTRTCTTPGTPPPCPHRLHWVVDGAGMVLKVLWALNVTQTELRQGPKSI